MSKITLSLPLEGKEFIGRYDGCTLELEKLAQGIVVSKNEKEWIVEIDLGRLLNKK